MRGLSPDRLRRTVTSAARSFDHEDVVDVHLRLIGIGKIGSRAIASLAPVAADVAGLAARHSVGRNAPMSGEDRGGHGLEEPHAARGAVSAVPSAGAAAAAADLV